ncbi:type II secretion system F family protein [Candidatus Poriferisodalis sp.]|uniref:type II secretion system F family protein n=1 Tax=Candidatus Poriferisodalis sp. TaxID=3101277 RepID=UPI003B01AC1A
MTDTADTADTPTLSRRAAMAANADVQLAQRLLEAGSSQSPFDFRARQLGGAAAALAASGVALSVVGVRPWLALTAAMFVAAVVFGSVEQLLGKSIAARRTQITEELPIVAEQIGMLLASGLSLTSALDAAARRGRGLCADGLKTVGARVAGGVPAEIALAEWADRAGSAEIRRFVGVLTLHEDTADMAALVSEEARASRMEAHRRLIAHIERRSEQVWIPVTVAALVPGCVLLAIPFSDALRGYTAL